MLNKTKQFSGKLLLIFFLLFIILPATAQKAKYVFLFIGDGMGLAAAATTQAYLASVNDTSGFQNLSFTSFPAIGLATTHAGNRFITCSAAAGTALATGNKTSINTISMDTKGENKLVTIAEEARDHGFKVGIISSVSIDHATPATFYAHQPDRDMYYEISLDLGKSNFNYFGGGGFYQPFGKNGDATISSYDFAKQNGYTITQTRADFDNLTPASGKVIATGNILESSGALRFMIDQTAEDIPLQDFVKKGIEMLDNKKGFFMMCEEGKIDWAAHSNDGATVIKNVLALDKAVNVAMDFYKNHPKETLIIVTADHETGGLAMGWAGTKYESNLKLLQYQDISMEHFSIFMDSLLSSTTNDTTAFTETMAALKTHFGLDDPSKMLQLKTDEKATIETAFYKARERSEKAKADMRSTYSGDNPVAVAAIKMLNNRSGLSWGSFAHTGIPVPVYAIGAGSELFDGYFDNTDIPKNIYKAMKLK